MRVIEARSVSINYKKGTLSVVGSVFEQIIYLSEEAREADREFLVPPPLIVPLCDSSSGSIDQVQRVCAECRVRPTSLELVHLRRRPLIEDGELGVGLLCNPGLGERKCDTAILLYSDLDDEQRKIVKENIHGGLVEGMGKNEIG